MLPHRGSYAQGREGELIGEGFACCDAGEACREAPQREGEGGDAAVVAATSTSSSRRPQTSAMRPSMRRWSGWPGRGRWQSRILVTQTASIPACLPEQLPWIGRGSSPLRISLSASGSYSGRWRRSAGPPRSGGLLQDGPYGGEVRLLGVCEAQATASSSSVSPKASAAPEMTSGSAWNGLARSGRRCRLRGPHCLEYVAIVVADARRPRGRSRPACRA
jgi:hypothetical protein